MWRALLPLSLFFSVPGQWASASFFSSACSPLPDDIHTNLPFFSSNTLLISYLHVTACGARKLFGWDFFFLLLLLRSSIFLVYQRHMDHTAHTHTWTRKSAQPFNNSCFSLAWDWNNKPLNKSGLDFGAAPSPDVKPGVSFTSSSRCLTHQQGKSCRETDTLCQNAQRRFWICWRLRVLELHYYSCSCWGLVIWTNPLTLSITK